METQSDIIQTLIQSIKGINDYVTPLENRITELETKTAQNGLSVCDNCYSKILFDKEFEL